MILDALLLSLTERFSQWTQRRIGVRSGDWYRFTLLSAIVLMAWRIVEARAANHAPQVGLGWVPFIVWFAILFRHSFTLDVYKRRRAALGIRGKEKRYGRTRRLLTGAAFVLLAGWGWTNVLIAIAGTLAMYFYACDDLPEDER
jgi:hypothetical protein